tara:strand:+ start:570 stop:890 length:321 start_codon:yes stop_codon:yes gene_type:complete
MIKGYKFEYGSPFGSMIPVTRKHRSRDLFLFERMIFDPVKNIKDRIFTRWEEIMKERKHPYAIYLLEIERTIEKKKYTEYAYTMVTNSKGIRDINNPPDSEGMAEP